MFTKYFRISITSSRLLRIFLRVVVSLCLLVHSNVKVLSLKAIQSEPEAVESQTD